MAELVASGLGMARGGATLVLDASVSVRAGELVVLLGANGAGKTSLLRMLAGVVTPDAGRVTVDGDDIATLSPVARARRIAYLPQAHSLAWPTSVRDVVALGRFAHGGVPGRLGQADAVAVDAALAACDLIHLASRAADSLSGGEAARMHCARAFAAQTRLMIADEPVAELDPLHQFRVMRLFRLFTETGGGALVVLHDLALAARIADRILWMKNGRIIADGSPADTITSAMIGTVYGVFARVEHDSGGPMITISGEA